MSRAKLPIRFPDWVPEPARRRIGELRETPWGIDDFGRDLLERLATRQAMKDEVWGKLPPEPKFIQEKIIDWVFFAVSIFPRLGRPYPKTMPKWREWAKQAQKYPRLPSPETVSGYALLLREGIYELKTETDIHWHRLWGGHASLVATHRKAEGHPHRKSCAFQRHRNHARCNARRQPDGSREERSAPPRRRGGCMNARPQSVEPRAPR